MDGSRRNPFEATGSASASFALRPALKSARGCGDASFELNASAFAVGSNDKILRLDLAVLIRAVQITAPESKLLRLNIDTSFAISFAAWLTAEKRDLGRAHSLMRPESRPKSLETSAAFGVQFTAEPVHILHFPLNECLTEAPPKHKQSGKRRWSLLVNLRRLHRG